MRCLIVTAHPDAGSLIHHLGDLVEGMLTRPGVEVIRFDLGQTGFAPAMTAQEWRSHFSPPFADNGIQDHVAALRRCDSLVLIAPVWWAGLPALMKGWLDRVWAPGYAFDPHRTPGRIKPLLTDLRHVVLITTHGAPWYVDWLIQRRPVQRMLRWSLLRLSAPQARLTSLSLYRAEGVTKDRLDRFITRIGKVFG